VNSMAEIKQRKTFPEPTKSPSAKAESVPSRKSLRLVIPSICLLLALGLYFWLDAPSSNGSEKLFTAEELQKYNGSDPRQPIYLAILGQVFDVSKAPKYYGKGGGYNGFAGRDGSAAFVTGDFTDKGLTDDLSSLTPEQVHGIFDWIDNTYNKQYIYKGKLIGRFYDSEGKETPALLMARNHKKVAADIKIEEKKDEERYPRCNTKWSQDQGGEVWCSVESGGAKRDWVGVPRQYTLREGAQTRCACVKPSVSDPRFKLYQDCDPNSSRCRTKPK